MQTVEDLFNNMDGIFSRQVDSPLKCVKITSDSNYIVAYCEHREYEGGNHVCENENFDQHIEYLILYDMTNKLKPRCVGNIDFNLDDNLQYQEEPSKLFKFFDDN